MYSHSFLYQETKIEQHTSSEKKRYETRRTKYGNPNFFFFFSSIKLVLLFGLITLVVESHEIRFTCRDIIVDCQVLFMDGGIDPCIRDVGG